MADSVMMCSDNATGLLLCHRMDATFPHSTFENPISFLENRLPGSMNAPQGATHVVRIVNVNVLDNPTSLTNPFQFEIIFESSRDLADGTTAGSR